MAAYMRSSGSAWKQQQQQQQQQVRRENSIGPLRRAHPASGATWNVQVVRGKMSTKCLWHACRALMVGTLLMIIGASMATIGYYSSLDFPINEFRHNSTIRVKNNDQRGLHLNNLSYMGPIIMGVGGFVVVSSCVMTFEARDSAAKVVPARFKLSNNGRNRGNGSSSRRTTTSVQSTESRKTSGGQSGRWEQHLGLFKSSPGSDLPTDRHALTAALIHFSRTLGSPKCVVPASSTFRRMSKSGSFPNLNEKTHITHPLLKSSGSPNEIRIHRRHHHHGGTKLHRTSKESTYLHPGLLRYHRHAISVDETSPLRRLNDSANGSQVSVTFDPTPEIIDIAPVHKKKPKCTRSDTSRKHVLSRQMPIEKEDPNASPYHHKRRRSSTMSENSCSSRKAIMAEAEISRRASSNSRTCSIDSRCMQNPSISSLCRSPDRNQKMGSNLSIDKENFRSQLSICSEPMVSVKQLSCQSSFEPCVVEEESANDTDEKQKPSVYYEETSERETKVEIEQSNNKNRPDSLILNTKSIEDQTTTTIVADGKKFLYRSQSNRSFKKPKAKPMKIPSTDLDQIYVISSNTCERSDLNDFYDSIEVITERRSRNKNFMEFNKCNDESETSCKNPSTSNEIVVEIESREIE